MRMSRVDPSPSQPPPPPPPLVLSSQLAALAKSHLPIAPRFELAPFPLERVAGGFGVDDVSGDDVLRRRATGSPRSEERERHRRHVREQHHGSYFQRAEDDAGRQRRRLRWCFAGTRVPSVRRGTIPQDATLTSGSGDAGAVRLVGGAMGSGVDLKRVSRLEMARPHPWVLGPRICRRDARYRRRR